MTNTIHLNQRYLIAGTGVTGIACLRYLLGKGVNCVLMDTRETIANASSLIQEFPKVQLVLGALDGFDYQVGDVLVVSPGLSLEESFIQAAIEKGVTLSSDVAIFNAMVTKPFIAITGSNGKSTVTSLVAHMLNAAGIRSRAIGNIGVPVLEAIDDDSVDVFVIELSSFQTERLEQLNCNVACILNISEDHLDRYASFQAYVDAKQAIYKQAKVCVYNLDDALTKPYGHSSDQLVSFSHTSATDFHVQDGLLMMHGQPLLATDKLLLRGLHNAINVLAALAMCQQLVISLNDENLSTTDCMVSFIEAAQSFHGLAHRCEFIGSCNGVDFINDSKATNVGASLAALDGLASSYKTIHLLLGGVDKDSDFSPLVSAVKSIQANAIIYGQDAPVISTVFNQEHVAHVLSTSFIAACRSSVEMAKKGDAVLLAPACASFDEFANFMQRGEAFKTFYLEASHQFQQRVNGGDYVA